MARNDMFTGEVQGELVDPDQDTGSALVPAQQDADTLMANVSTAHKALQAATNDFTRLRIRDEARAFQAAAKILNHRDIQAQASVLVADAERAIYKANSTWKKGRPAAGDAPEENVTPVKHFPEEAAPAPVPEVPRVLLHRVRKAHAGLDDQKYDNLRRQSLENKEPLQRSTLEHLSRAAIQAKEHARDEAEQAAQGGPPHREPFRWREGYYKVTVPLNGCDADWEPGALQAIAESFCSWQALDAYIARQSELVEAWRATARAGTRGTLTQRRTFRVKRLAVELEEVVDPTPEEQRAEDALQAERREAEAAYAP